MANRQIESKVIVVQHFEESGYSIETVLPDSLKKEATERGQYIRCIDPRIDNRTLAHHIGPAVPGGVLGLAFLIEDSKRAHGILAKSTVAMERVVASNFHPSIHGDLENGEVKGCKFLKALTERVIPGAHLSEEQILDLIRSNGIAQTTLRGKAKPIGFAVNFEPDTTIIPMRAKYCTDIWYLDELGLNPNQYAPKLVAIADLLLARENRRLIVAA